MRLEASLLAAALATAGPPAAAFVATDGQLTAERACDALASLRRATNPDARRLAPGAIYEVLGLNDRDGAWVQVRVPDAAPPARWVERDCGRLRLETTPRGGGGTEALAPFFDNRVDGPNDPTPAPPVLSALDEAMLEVCGAWGSRPDERTFRMILDRSRLAAEIAELHRELAGRVLKGPLDLPAFKDELARVWFAADGFAHVFCGEPDESGIGGLHYRARLLELQDKRLAGLAPMEACKATEIDPPVYAIGIRYRRPDGGFGLACPKSYAYDQDAMGILVAAVLGLRAAVEADGRMCLVPVASGGRRYVAVFIQRGGAIVTLYPDATPACPGGGGARTCLCFEEKG